VTTLDEQVAAFDAAGADYAELASWLWDPLGRILARHAAPRGGDRVLDACCGTGASALPTARAVGPTGRVDAVDLARSLLERGQAAATGLPQLRFIHADVSTWRPPGGAYDLVQSGYGVFFLPDMDAGARHLISLLRPGGRFAVQTWREGALASFAGCLFDTIAAQAPAQLPRWQPPRASGRIGTAAKLSGWLSSLGLTGVRVQTVDYVQPLTPGLAWGLVRGSGWRLLLAGLGDAATTRIRDGLLQAIRQRGLTMLDASSLAATASVPG
jgi:trans-aconitate methyltransferase